MIIHTLKNLITSKDLSAQIKTNEIMKLQGSLIFYNTGIETGLFKILTEPLSLQEIAAKLNIKNIQLLGSLLNLGCSLKEISSRNGRYRLRGAMSKALVNNLPITELVRETVQYHADVALRLNSYLLKDQKGDYLKKFGGIIAESSRILEPMIRSFIYQTVKRNVPLKILEFGCGAGEYLRYYVEINKNNGGIAIDIDPSAVEIASRKVREYGIERNFVIKHADIMKPETVGDTNFDLITSFSNMHYFTDEQKVRLFGEMHKLLNKDGRFILATGFKNSSLSSCYYDLLFSASMDLYPLPDINDIVKFMKIAGFSRVKTVNIFGKSFRGIVAFK